MKRSLLLVLLIICGVYVVMRGGVSSGAENLDYYNTIGTDFVSGY